MGQCNCGNVQCRLAKLIEECKQLSDNDKLVLASHMFQDGEQEMDESGQIVIYTGIKKDNT